MVPSSEHFTALARSSPWRWASLRFTVSWEGPSQTWPEPLRAWVRRPDALRVETLSGDLVDASVRSVSWGGSSPTVLHAPLDPAAPQPELDASGLVVRRPPDDGRILYDDPMFQNYQWVAMLDPVELADGRSSTGEPRRGSVEIGDVREADHHGRPAWEAVARPTPAYVPRCSCCALLFSAAILDSGPADARWLEPDFRFPDAHRVRLDVATGVCVLTEELGGSRAGAGHDVAIEAVNGSMGDDLFSQQSLSHGRHRRWGRRPG